MAAYLMVQTTVTDEARFQKYRDAYAPVMAKFGGKFIVRRGAVDVLEGEHDSRPMVVFEFPTMEALHGFWHSPDYVEAKKLRTGAATMTVWAVPGV
jgi:uncharacterized protein (DUF1330 family)